MSTKVGTFVKIKIGTALMVGETSVSLSSAVTMIETSSKTSGNASTFEYGRIAETISIASIGTTDSTETAYNFQAARTAAKAGTKVTFEMTEYDSAGSEVAGAHNIAGTALVQNVTWDNPDNDVTTFSLDLQVDDETTDTVNS